MRFTIRKVDNADALVRAAINAMIDEVSQSLTWIYGERCTEAGDWWIAFNGKTEAAFAGLTPAKGMPGVGYVCADGVLEPYRGHGLQKRLLRRRIAWARHNNYNALVCDVIHHNAASINSLIACGFKQFVPEKPWGRMADVCFWRLEL